VLAVTFQGPQDLRCERVPDPRIEDSGDALVRVELTAVCGSDLHVWHGRERGLDAGTVMGHEFIGRVVDVGSAVSRVARDVRVLSPFTTSCGSCFYCRSGLTSRCESGRLFGWVEDGAGLHGGQAELVRVPLADSTLLPIPEGVGPEEALLLGDVLSTGYFCARQAGVTHEGVYVVVGCGPVGLSAIVGARELGAERVFAIDSIPERLERARDFGAEPIDFTARDAVEVLREATGGRGADAVLEVVGSPDAHRAAIDLVRPGGTISVVGVHNEDSFVFSPAEAYDKNLTYRVGRCPARHIAEELIPLAQSGRYDLASIFSHRMPLERGPEAYRMFDAKEDGCTKVVLVPS
jgi:threonine dehydrogenase-like Zn-dependent dehydrogenase